MEKIKEIDNNISDSLYYEWLIWSENLINKYKKIL